MWVFARVRGGLVDANARLIPQPLLHSSHHQVSSKMKKYTKGVDAGRKKLILDYIKRLLAELTVHIKIEDRIHFKLK